MNSLTTDYSRPKPDEVQLNQAWQELKMIRNETLTLSAQNLIDEFKKCWVNGGLKIDKYTLDIPDELVWFTSRNAFEDIHFLNKLARHPGLSVLRSELQVKGSKPELKKYPSDFHLFNLAGQLATELARGGAYLNCDPLRAWEVATAFIADEFENRFLEICYFPVRWKQAAWFNNVAWDFSAILFDKRKHEITFLNATDTD